VLVTVGAAEANYITTITLAGPGDTVAVMLPNYMQVWGIARNLAMQVRPFHLDESAAWSAPPAGIAAAVVPGTALVAVCNPNNPTGHALSTLEMDAIVAAADRVGAWILADEVYAGAERLGGGPSPSFFGRYDKVVATGSMSKAYGLPGLRIGWAVGPVHVIDDIWARHEYTTISASTVSNHLAAHALSPPVRERLLERTREYIRSGYSVLEQWLAGHGGTFDVVPPDAAAIAFVRYHLDIGSADLAERLRTEQSVLVVPGSHFGMDRFLRISFGLPKDYLTTALDRMHDLIAGLSAA
jgi:aspartate/methionine/tyrosine aminotransferase